MVAQAAHAALSSASENVVPASQAPHCVSAVAVHADVCPWPKGHVAQVAHAALSSAAENVVPASQAPHCVSAVAVHADVCPSPAGHVEQPLHFRTESQLFMLVMHSIMFTGSVVCISK